MTEQHPISPPPELVVQWCEEAVDHLPTEKVAPYMAKRAAQWGADKELDAICHWLRTGPYGASIACGAEQMISDLRAARRPKPLSLKEQALLQLGTLNADLTMHGLGCDLSHIRRALWLLPDNPTP